MTNEEYIDRCLTALFLQSKAQFGDAIKSVWFCDEDHCPGCGSRQIGAVRYEGQDALSLNAFIYRKHGALIGYLLCRKCVTSIMKANRKNPHVQTPLHAVIEENLIEAYRRHLEKFEA